MPIRVMILFRWQGNIFSPVTSGTVTQVDFAGSYGEYTNPGPIPTTTNSFTLSLYSVSAGAPGTLIATSLLSNVNRVDTHSILGGFYELFDFSGIVNTPFSLTAGNSYYLGFSDSTSPYGDFAIAETASPGPATTEATLYKPSNSFHTETGVSLSFELNSTPEPSTLAFLFGGLGIVFVFYRRLTADYPQSDFAEPCSQQPRLA